MMRCLLASPFVLFAVLGCRTAERPFTDNSKDPELYAQDVKQIAHDAIQRARQSREPADQLQTLVTELEGQESNSRPVGSHKPTYAELLTATKQLIEECKKANGKPANLSARLDALKLVADKLPGQVQVGREEPKSKEKKDPSKD